MFSFGLPIFSKLASYLDGREWTALWQQSFTARAAIIFYDSAGERKQYSLPGATMIYDLLRRGGHVRSIARRGRPAHTNNEKVNIHLQGESRRAESILGQQASEIKESRKRG